MGSHPFLRLGSSLRIRSADETLARAIAIAPALGISRVTDVTRMDRLGLPVFVSVRPRGLSLRVHAGKGLASVDACVGALMEAIEFAVAEPQRTSWRADRVSLAQLEACWGGGFDLLDLGPHIGIAFDERTMFDAIACENLLGGPALPIPAERVFFPFDSPDHPDLLTTSTNGLASGNSIAEATLHGLLEVLERDAEAMNVADDKSRWIDPAELPPPFAQLARRWRAMGVDLAVRLLPNAFGLPCFEAVLHAQGSEDVNLSGGFGLHLERDIALARAVAEAAQARISHIHGGRDDLAERHERGERLGREGRRERDAEAVALKFDRSRRVHYDAVPDFACDDGLDEVLDAVLHHLGELGFGQVLRHRFDIDLGGLEVVRVVVPRCEDFWLPCVHMGRRLRRLMLSDA